MRVEHTLSGKLCDGLLPDVIQLIGANRMTGVLTIESQGVTILVYMNDGELWAASATSGNLSPHQAFFAAISVGNGVFAFDESMAITVERTIEGNMQLLILEGLRLSDEHQRGGEHGAGDV